MSVSVTFHLIYVQIIFSSLKAAESEWPPFEKGLLTWLTICSLCIKSVILVISRFGFEDRIWVLIAPVPGHCFIFMPPPFEECRRA